MKKTICFLLTALLTLASLSFGQANALAAPANPVKCAFNSSQFGGKIRECAYAGDGKLFVVADKLYLYDTATDSVLVKTETPLRYFEVQAIDKGYILSGMGDDGMMVYIYDSALTLTKKIAVNHLLTEDFVVSETGTAASTDGKKLAIATLRGLYLYDLEKEKLTTLLDLTKKAGTSKIQISIVDGVAFSPDNSQIMFYGGGQSIPAKKDENSFSIYGSLALDGSNLKLTTPSSYSIEEIQRRTDRLFFPQTFTRCNGTLLWLDRKTGDKNTLSFATEKEGRNGVYSSERGNYVATAVLDGNLTVRVYEAASGKLIATKVIQNSNKTYFYRIPSIYLLDEAKTAVVLLGGGIGEVDTLVSTFTFGE